MINVDWLIGCKAAAAFELVFDAVLNEAMSEGVYWWYCSCFRPPIVPSDEARLADDCLGSDDCI